MFHIDPKQILVSLGISLIISFIIFLNLNDYGITWDEPIYFVYGDQYVEWLKKPQWANKDEFFKVNSRDFHPPFRKLIGGLTHEFFVNKTHLIDNTRGYRISSLLFVFPFILLYSYIAIRHFGYLLGCFTPFMFSLLPHVFFYTPLMAMDYAIAVIWFTAVVTVMKGMKNFFWFIISTILVGFCMLTKLYGFLLIIPIVIYWIWYEKTILFGKTTLYKKLSVFPKILSIVGGALVVYVVFWPWLWDSPLRKFGDYLALNFSHQGVPVALFGQVYTHAPWWYTPIMFLTTTPLFVLFFFFLGAVHTLRKTQNQWDKIMLLNAFFPMIFFSLPGIFRYDGVRLFLASFPFVCLIAARGIQQTVKIFKRKLQPIAIFIIGIGWIITIYTSLIEIHPWESSYYNELVGGVRGASVLGFEAEFWGNAYMGVLPWMNANKKDMMCVYPTTQPFYYYQAMGQIESGVVFNAGRGACKYMVVLMRQGMFDSFVAQMVKSEKPIYQLLLKGVPLVGIYNIEGR